MRKTALVAGVLYLVTFVTSIPALPLYHDLVNDPNYLLNGASDTGVLWGACGELLCGLAGIGTAVTLFPVLKRQSETAALGFVTSRILEAAMIFVGVLSVLSLVTLHQDGAAGSDAVSLLSTGRALVALHDWTFLLGPGIMPAVNALFLGYALYRARLVPRILPTLGFIGAVLLVAAAIATIFGSIDQVSPISAVAALPIATWEFSLGVWLIVKGFRSSPITSNTVPATVMELDGELVTVA